MFHILIVLAVVITLALAGYVFIKYKKSREDEPEDLEIYT
jgi:flagellar basal body-associated protein FliL